MLWYESPWLAVAAFLAVAAIIIGIAVWFDRMLVKPFPMPARWDGTNQAHPKPKARIMSTVQMQADAAEFRRALAKVNDILAQTRPISRRERIVFRAWALWYAIKDVGRW